jgi:hypothetical protein
MRFAVSTDPKEDHSSVLRCTTLERKPFPAPHKAIRDSGKFRKVRVCKNFRQKYVNANIK